MKNMNEVYIVNLCGRSGVIYKDDSHEVLVGIEFIKDNRKETVLVYQDDFFNPKNFKEKIFIDESEQKKIIGRVVEDLTKNAFIVELI